MIRLASILDVDNIIKGEIEVFGKTLGNTIKEDINSNYGKYFIIEEDEFIGYIGLRIIDDIEIMNFYILKKYQSKGYGDKLFKYIIKYADDLKKNIILEVGKSNYKAINLYKKYNFKEIRIIKNYYSNDDAVVMQRGVM